MKFLVFLLALCLGCFTALAESNTETWTGGGSAGQSRVEEVEKDSERVVRRHGFSRDDERKATTIKVPSRNQRSSRQENKRAKPAGRKDDTNYGYPARAAETAPEVQAETKSKFGPPPRKYDDVSPAAEAGEGRGAVSSRSGLQADSKTELGPPPRKYSDPSQAAATSEELDESRWGAGSRHYRSNSNAAKRGTVIKLPPKKANEERQTRPKAAKQEDPYGYHPERTSLEKPAEKESPTVRSGRDRNRKVTTITLPSRNASSEEQATAEAVAADDGGNSKFSRKSGRSDRRFAANTAAPPRATVDEGFQSAQEDPKPIGKRERRSGRGSSKAKAEEGVKTAALPPEKPAAPPVRLPVNSAEDMKKAYQVFDRIYENSLGKSRKELNDLWGFPMQRMGGDENEPAYGFRQRGILADDPQAASQRKVTHHYTSGEARPGQTGRNFACLVILWIDKGGRGEVIDGEAIGDCFLVEALPQKPLHFER